MADQERLMTAVVGDLEAGRSELKALELPEGQRKKAEPFLLDVDRVINTARKIRNAGTDHVKVWMIAYEERVTALDLQEDAQAAGLRRCGREASTKAVDAVMMPGYAKDVAELAALLIAPIQAAERLPEPGHGRAYWNAVAEVTQTPGTGRDPESLSDLETDFTGPLNEAKYTVDDLLRHYDGTVRLPAKELREKERRTYAVAQGAREGLRAARGDWATGRGTPAAGQAGRPCSRREALVKRAAPLILVVVMLAGCGGGGEQASPTDRWRKQADAACERAETAIREGGQARDVGDLDRVMVRVGDIVLATLDQIEALKVPEEAKAAAAPAHERLGEVRKSVGRVRKAVEGGDEFDIGVAAGDVRTAGNSWFKTAERAGLKRCGRRAVTDAAVDELMMPGFVAASAESAVRLHRQVRTLRRLLAATSTDAERIRLWKQTPGVIAYVEEVSPNQVPERLDKYRFDADPTMDLETTAEEAIYWYRRGNTAKARAREARFFALQAKAEKTVVTMFEAAGAAGRELIPDLRREFRRGGSSSSGSPS